MINTVKSTALLGDPRDEPRSGRQHPDSDRDANPASPPIANAQPDIRLVIEQDDARGGLTYKLIDRATGEVMSVVSREELIRISADPSYTAGALISTKA
jgi:hypothetical protein